MIVGLGRLPQYVAIALALFGTPALAQNLVVKGTTTAEGNADFISDVNIVGTLTAVGNANVHGNASVVGSGTFGQNVTVTGNATTQNLHVTGTTTGGGNATFQHNVDVAGSLTVAGRNVPQALVPPGAVIAFAGPVTSPPAGYLACNGQLVSRAAYPALFAAIGTAYGAGDGSTTFKLPDLRGEFIRGLDGGRNVDLGRTLGSAQADEFKSHTHDIQTDHADTINDGRHIDSTDDYREDSGIIAYNHALARGGAETRPRNIAMNYLIKY